MGAHFELKSTAPLAATNGHARNGDDLPHDRGSLRVEGQVQRGLNLFLTLKNPAQMPALLNYIRQNREGINDALESLHYVHFARFLPARDGTVLHVITVFDGDRASYIMDFVAKLHDAFTEILTYVKDAPRLPVNEYPLDFLQFIHDNDLDRVVPWSAYSDTTVIEIQQIRGLR